MGTYNPTVRRIHEYECLDCPAGYLCNDTAIANLTEKECPMGHYCPRRSSKPTPCAPGYYNDEVGGEKEGDCKACPGGAYCPLGSTYPIRCEDGDTCPGGSALPRTCEGGFYCNRETSSLPSVCPVNSKCPRGSGYPIKCEGREICPWGTEYPIICEAGFEVKDYSKTGAQNRCMACPAGTYASLDDLTCQPCKPGYVCYGKTNRADPTEKSKHNGELCPKGHYCPEGTK